MISMIRPCNFLGSIGLARKGELMIVVAGSVIITSSWYYPPIDPHAVAYVEGVIPLDCLPLESPLVFLLQLLRQWHIIN